MSQTAETPTSAQFGPALRAARIAAGYLTAIDAGARVGLHQSNYSRLETARVADPRWSTCYRLITELSLPLEAFYPADLILEAAKRLQTSA